MISSGRSGLVDVQRRAKGKKFSINGGGTLPMPEAISMFQEYDLDNFEQTVRRIFQRFLEAQLLEAPTASPSPSANG